MASTVPLGSTNFVPFLVGPGREGEVVLELVKGLVRTFGQQITGDTDIERRTGSKCGSMMANKLATSGVDNVSDAPFEVLPGRRENTDVGGICLEQVEVTVNRNSINMGTARKETYWPEGGGGVTGAQHARSGKPGGVGGAS